VADNVDFTKLIAAIDRLEKAMSSSAKTSSSLDEDQAIAKNIKTVEAAEKEIESYKTRLEAATRAEKANLETKNKRIKAEERLLQKQQEALDLKIRTELATEKEAAKEQAAIDAATDRIKALKDKAKTQGRFNDILGASLGLGRKNVLSLMLQKGSFEALTDSIKENITVSNILNSLTSKFIEASAARAWQLSAARAEFIRTTGASEELASSLGAFTNLELGEGIGFQEQSEGLIAVRQGLSGVGTASNEAQEELAIFAARSQQLNVAAETSIANLDSLNKVFALNIEQAQEASNRISEFGIAIGIGAGRAQEEFRSLTPFLARFGNDAEETFRGVATEAAATGVAIGSLASAIERLDSFDAASESAATLNAALGTSISSFELLQAEGVEKIRLLQDQLRSAGVDFNSLNRFEKDAIAGAAGLSSIEEASRLFSGTSAEQTARLQEQQQAQIDLDRQRELSLSAQQKLAKAAEAFTALAVPLLAVLEFLAFVVYEASTAFGGFIPIILTAGLGLKLLHKAYKFLNFEKIKNIGLTIKSNALKLVEYIRTKLQAKAELEQAAATATNDAVQKKSIATKVAAGAAAGASAGGMLAFGAAVLLVGAGIGLAAWGLAQFVASFQGMEAGQIAAVALALFTFALALAALTIPLTFLSGPVGWLIAAALGGLSLVFVALGAATGMAASSLTEIASSLSTIASLTTLAAVASSVSTLSEALNDMPTEGINIGVGVSPEGVTAYSNMLDSYTGAVRVSAENPEAVQEMTNAIVAAGEISVQGTSIVDDMYDAFTSALSGAFGGPGGQREIVMTLNDREFGRAVVDVVDENINTRIRG